MLLFAEHLHDEILEDVAHRHIVMSIPKWIRAFLRYDRKRNSVLFHAAWESIRQLYQEVCPEGTPGLILALHSANDFLQFNPHLHGIIADGLFLPDGSFQDLTLDTQALQKLFEYKVLKYLRDDGIIPDSVVSQIQSWRHSGFSAWLGPKINPQEQDARLFVSEYVNKAQIKLGKLEIIEAQTPEQTIIRCHKEKDSFKDYSPMDLLAAITPMIPNRWEQTVHYMGHYSSRTRGKKRKLALEEQNNDPLTLVKLPPLKKEKASRSWVRLIRKIYEADPLVCPKCDCELKIIAVIVDPKQAKRITSHLGIPPYRAPPPFGPKKSFSAPSTTVKNAA
jgi:hypothetical protein